MVPVNPVLGHAPRRCRGGQWFLATDDARAVGLRGLSAVLVPLEEAEIYDGRDNEEMKRRYFEAVLKVPLKVVPISADVR